MKTRSCSSLLLVALAGFFAAGLSHTAVAQTPTPVPTTSHPPHDRTAQGVFRSSDGKEGTYVETYTTADSTVTDAIVYTLKDSTETSTETLTTTSNADGTKTVVFSELGFGATAAFTSTTTYTVSQGGNAVGTGTFTAADGTTGTLAAIVTKSEQTSIASIDLTSAAGVLTRQLRLEERSGGGDSLKTLAVDATGALTTTTITRFGGMHHQHP